MVLYEYRKHNADAFARFYYCFFCVLASNKLRLISFILSWYIVMIEIA